MVTAVYHDYQAFICSLYLQLLSDSQGDEDLTRTNVALFASVVRMLLLCGRRMTMAAILSSLNHSAVC